MLPQKVLIDVDVDSFTDANLNDRTLLDVPAHHSQAHLLQSSLGKGRDAAGLHISHREVHQVAAVVVVDVVGATSPVEVFSSEKIQT
jgi:hypothetical protein